MPCGSQFPYFRSVGTGLVFLINVTRLSSVFKTYLKTVYSIQKLFFSKLLIFLIINFSNFCLNSSFFVTQRRCFLSTIKGSLATKYATFSHHNYFHKIFHFTFPRVSVITIFMDFHNITHVIFKTKVFYSASGHLLSLVCRILRQCFMVKEFMLFILRKIFYVEFQKVFVRNHIFLRISYEFP